MKNLSTAISNLKSIVDFELIKYSIPIEEKNTIRIKNTLIRPGRKGFVIVDTIKNKTIAKTHTKIAALAVAKLYVDNKTYNSVFVFDNQIEKNTNDIEFYDNIIARTEDLEKKLNCQIRRSFACEQVDIAKSKLNDQILHSIR